MIQTDEVAKGIYRVAFWDEADLADTTFPGFSYNLFVVAADKPAIIQTMFRRTFGRVREQVAGVIDPEGLRYVVVPHHTGDSSGALNQWLEAAPEAQAVCTALCSRLSLHDYADRIPKVVEDGAVLDLGSHRLQFLATPHVDQWDSMMVYEETTGTLFSNDLFSVPGTEATTAEDLSDLALAVARQAGYNPDAQAAIRGALDKLEYLDIRLLAPMHGPVVTDHVQDLLRCFRKNSLTAPLAA